MTHKQLKDFFKITNVNGQIKCCTDYEITKARLHSKIHGAAAETPKADCVIRVRFFCLTISNFFMYVNNK